MRSRLCPTLALITQQEKRIELLSTQVQLKFQYLSRFPPVSSQSRPGATLQHHICSRSSSWSQHSQPSFRVPPFRPTPCYQSFKTAGSVSASGVASINSFGPCASSKAIATSLSASTFTGAGVHCRAAPRPMWAAKEPEPSGDVVSRMITKEITACRQTTDLEDVCSKWASRCDRINASAALVKLAKLHRGRASPALFKQLASIWLGVLPDAEIRECANVLWACAKLGVVSNAQVLNRTWEAFFSMLKKDAGSSVAPQEVSSVLWACAKLRKQPTADELQLLLQALLQPDVLSVAKAQAIANTVWSLARLQQLPGWQGGVSEQDIQQLLAEQQLQVLTTHGSDQAVSNVLGSLAHLATGPHHLVGLSFARHAANQLLAGRLLGSLSSWESQHITNSMWACGELGLVDEQFMAVAVAAAPQWVPRSTDSDLTQALIVCAQLQYRDYGFLQQLLQQGQKLLQLQPGKKVGPLKPLPDADKGALAAMFGWSVALLDMQELAGAARALVTSSGIIKQPRTHPSNLRRLWVFHCWLLQHQLLDGKGLTGLLTEQQLKQGEKEAAVYDDK